MPAGGPPAGGFCRFPPLSASLRMCFGAVGSRCLGLRARAWERVIRGTISPQWHGPGRRGGLWASTFQLTGFGRRPHARLPSLEYLAARFEVFWLSGRALKPGSAAWLGVLRGARYHGGCWWALTEDATHPYQPGLSFLILVPNVLIFIILSVSHPELNCRVRWVACTFKN